MKKRMFLLTLVFINAAFSNEPPLTELQASPQPSANAQPKEFTWQNGKLVEKNQSAPTLPGAEGTPAPAAPSS